MGPWPNAKENKGYAYLLVVEDCFSRFCWVVPQRELTAKTTWEAFNAVLRESGRKPRLLWLDEGTAFLGIFAKRCAESGIGVYSTHGTHKAAMVERLNRTIGEAVYKKLTELNTKTWLGPVLDNAVAAYNASPHRATGMSPAAASQLDASREQALHAKLYGTYLRATPAAPRFRVGDWVRLSRDKSAFEKGRSERWTVALYEVIAVLDTVPRTYKLADHVGDEVVGSFYGAELQRSAFDPESQLELLAPRRKAGPNEVEKVLGYRLSAKDKSRFGKYILKLQFGDGSVEEQPLSDFVGREVKGKFVPSQRAPEQILRPVDEWLRENLPAVFALV